MAKGLALCVEHLHSEILDEVHVPCDAGAAMSKLDDFEGDERVAAEYSDVKGCPKSDSGYHCSCYGYTVECCLCDERRQVEYPA